MATVVRGRADDTVKTLKQALGEYEAEYPGAAVSLYRQGIASVRIRVIDRRFEGMSKSRRHEDVWTFLSSRVPEDMLAEVSLVLPLAPAELKTSLANHEFENPIGSRL